MWKYYDTGELWWKFAMTLETTASKRSLLLIRSRVSRDMKECCIDWRMSVGENVVFSWIIAFRCFHMLWYVVEMSVEGEKAGRGLDWSRQVWRRLETLVRAHFQGELNFSLWERSIPEAGGRRAQIAYWESRPMSRKRFLFFLLFPILIDYNFARNFLVRLRLVNHLIYFMVFFWL